MIIMIQSGNPSTSNEKAMFETCATQTSKEGFDPNARFTTSPQDKPLEAPTQAPTEAPTEAPMDPGIKVG